MSVINESGGSYILATGDEAAARLLERFALKGRSKRIVFISGPNDNCQTAVCFAADNRGGSAYGEDCWHYIPVRESGRFYFRKVELIDGHGDILRTSADGVCEIFALFCWSSGFS
jgi:hypothetical protein